MLRTHHPHLLIKYQRPTIKSWLIFMFKVTITQRLGLASVLRSPPPHKDG